VNLTSHPTILLLTLWPAIYLIATVRSTLGWPTPAALHRVTLAAGLIVLCTYCCLVLWYASQPSYFDAAEPTITAVASVFAAGKPLYPALDDPHRYAHVYGPFLFLIHAAALTAAGPSITASKAVGAVAAFSSLILAHRLFSRSRGAFPAVMATASCALVFMAFGNVSFWTRADPLLVLSVVLALHAVSLPGPVYPLILLGAVTGVAINLKLTGFLYVLPIGMLAVHRLRPRVVIATALVFTIVALAPFLLPNVSLQHYRDYLYLAAQNGLVAAQLRHNLEWCVFLAAPVAGLLWTVRRASTPWSAPYVVGFALSMLAVAGAAAKPGGGPLHLLPFVPVLAKTIVEVPDPAWNHRSAKSLAIAFLSAALLLAVPKQFTFVTTMAQRDLRPALLEIRSFAQAHRSSRMEVGYGGTSYVPYARPEMVFATREYLLDEPAIQEYRLSGMQIPQSTIRVVDECRVDYWLLPRGEDPFVVPSAYYPVAPRDVFPDSFRSAFLRHYKRSAAMEQFDVWQCR
jgi:hypothetical protein